MSQAVATEEVSNQLIPLTEFKLSGRCPVEPYHMIFLHKHSLEKYEAIFRYGKKWLVDETKFMDWLRDHSRGRV